MDPKDHAIPDEHQTPRTGQWLPQDRRHSDAWLHKTIKHVDQNPPDELHPVLQEFKQMVEEDTRLFCLFSNMFEEIPRKFHNDPSGRPTVRDFDHMLVLLNHIITTAPGWDDAGQRVGLVGVPINAILEWPMATPSGMAVFFDPKVNAMIKKVLNVWGEFLQSPESAYVLDDDAKTGWLGDHGVKQLVEVANLGVTHHSFDDLFICDPTAKNHGFKSWDDFFVRHFKEGARPVASPDDDDVIANACESMVYKTAHNVKARDRFWVKGQPYSVIDMLNRDPLHEQFVGGTIYQAFLSALSYHRWHTPVSGTVKKAYLVDGTYFAEPRYTDFKGNKAGFAQEGEIVSQEFLSAVATRAIIFIEADNPKIGLMCFIGVGMTEVSTCDIGVKEGQHIKKGDELGMFHFGGSSHCLLFRSGVKVEGFPKPGGKWNVPVRSELARVV